jgi:peptide/nickel transport system substrate-binding protein
MIDRLLNGQAILADGPIFPGTWAYNEAIQRQNYDAAQAQDLLINAGYNISAEDVSVRMKDGVQLAFTLIYPDNTRA